MKPRVITQNRPFGAGMWCAAAACLVSLCLVAGCPQMVPDGGGDENVNASGSGSGSSSENSNTSESGNENDNSSVSQEAKDVGESLRRLGVDTTITPRTDENGEELPDDYSPLGASSEVNQTMELFFIGPRVHLLSDESPLPNRSGFIELTNDDTAELETSYSLIEDEQTWEQDELASRFGNLTTRSAAAGDIDGDGFDEIVVAYLMESSASGAERLFVEIVEPGMEVENDPEAGKPSVSAPRNFGDFPGAKNVNIEVGDFNGDGMPDLALGITFARTADLHIFLSENEQYSTEPDVTMSYDAAMDGDSLDLHFEIAAGNLDRDNGEELAVILNEYDGIGDARLWVYDDAKTEFAPLVDEMLVFARDGQLYTAQVADVSMGDIDADGRDEIVIAGLTEFHNDGCMSYGHIIFALEDAVTEEDEENGIVGALKTIDAKYIDEPYFPSGSGCNSNSHTMKVRKVFVNAFDVDGDGVDEIQAGRYLFEDFAAALPWTQMGPEDDPFILPYDEWRNSSTTAGYISNSSSVMVTADVTGDEREDLISYMQWRREVSVWGLIGPSEETWEWTKASSVPTENYNFQSRVFPIILPCNVDVDGIKLQYSEAQYELVFTEPIILAALAAAPCQADIGQNIDACRTAYGRTTSTTGGIDGSVTVRGSAWVGAEAKFFGVGASTRKRLSVAASFSAAQHYELSETVRYTTGPMEDTVIFTTVPLDQYTYRVLTHPDPDVVGDEVVISLPRSPITIQVERDFYNNNVVDGGFKVDRNVFQHTPGDVDSYPREADADLLIDTGGLGFFGPLGDLVDAVGEALGPIPARLVGNGLKGNEQTVGQGGGQVGTEIEFAEQTSYRASTEIGFDYEAETTAGAVVGFSVGGSVEAGLSWGSGESTVYSGTVGSIDTTDGQVYSDNLYNFGLFTYIYNYGDPTKPQFEVLHYYTERP